MHILFRLPSLGLTVCPVVQLCNNCTVIFEISVCVQLFCLLCFRTLCNQKSELMFMRRAKIYSSSCSQVVLVHVHPFRSTSVFCSRKSQKNIKNHYFGSSKSFKVIDVDTTTKSTLPVLVMISSTFVPLCNRFHVAQANSGKITTYKAGTPI